MIGLSARKPKMSLFWPFGNLNFGFVSDLEISISDLSDNLTKDDEKRNLASQPF
jgi:hypothetical protein